MNKILKISLITTASVLGVAVAGAAYLAATFDPNAYKQQIIQSVKDSKQRTLHLDGDIKLSFFPNIGVSMAKVSLSEFKSEQEFAALDSARVSLALLPLFSKQIIVNEVSLSGMHATLFKHKDGSTNIDDLLSPAPATASPDTPAQATSPVQFDIAKVMIDKTKLEYVDELSGAKYAIKDLSLTTGRIANGVPVKIEMAVGVEANQPKLNIQTQLSTTLTFDLDKQSYQLAGLDMKVSGAVLDITQLQIQTSGDASANLSTQEFSAKELSVKVSGIKGKEAFTADLSAPDLNLNKDHYTSSELTLNATMDAAFGKLQAALSVPDISGNAQAFKVENLSLDAQVQQPEQSFKFKLSSPLAGNMAAQRFDLSNLSIAVSAVGDKLPNKSISSQMKGNLQVDLKKQSVQTIMSGGLLQSQVRAKVGMQGFTQPAIKFDVNVDQFDADLYLPKKATEAPKVEVAQPEQPLDLSALRTLNLEGSLRVGSLKVANVRVEQLRVDVQAHKGIVNISPLSAKLYQGSTNGSISIDAQATPTFTVKQDMVGIDIAPLGKDAANFDTLEGHGNVSVNVSTKGDTVSALKRALNGTATLNLKDGAIKGINVAQKIRDVKSTLGAKTQTTSADKSEKTDFSELKASFKINNGVAHNDDLSMMAPLLRLSGAGDIDIGHDSIDYLAKATLANTLKGQGGDASVSGLTVPLRVKGPFSELKYNIEFGAMVSDQTKQKITAGKAAVQQKIDTKKEEVKTQVKDQLKDQLKGLFK